MVGDFPPFVLRRLWPLLTRVLGSHFQSEAGGMIEQHANLFDRSTGQQSPIGVFDRDRTIPWD
jgi:hypothetical protein